MFGPVFTSEFMKGPSLIIPPRTVIFSSGTSKKVDVNIAPYLVSNLCVNFYGSPSRMPSQQTEGHRRFSNIATNGTPGMLFVTLLRSGCG